MVNPLTGGNAAKRDWAKQRPEVFHLDGEVPDEPILWTPITGETHGQMRNRVMGWAKDADLNLGEILNALFFRYPKSLSVLQLADYIGVPADEALSEILAQLEALGLVLVMDGDAPHVQAADLLFSAQERRSYA